MLVFTIVQATKLATYKATIDNRIKIVEDDNKRQEECIKNLTKKVNDGDVTFMEIRTKLANIEALLMEMKQQIKNK
jgi:hypothetical protein